MADVGEVRARVVLDTSGLERSADKAKASVRGIGDADNRITWKGLKQGDAAAQTLSKTLTGTGRALTAAVTVPMAAMGALSLKAAVDIDTGLTDVRKTVNGTEEDYAKLKEAAIEFSQVNAVGAAELLSIESLGAQLGYTLDLMSNGKSEVQEFGEVVSGLDIATNMDAETAGMEMAQFFNIMGENKELTENYGAAIVGLGNNFATVESDISAMALRIAGAGKNIGLSSADVLGLATALTSLGIQAEMGGTAISTIMSNIDKDVALGNENLQTWADTAEMSVEQFKRDWGEDAVATLDAVFKGMQSHIDNEGSNLAVMLDELGISSLRQTDTMKRLANSGDLMSRSVARANEEWEKNTALSNEVANRNDSLAAKFEMLKNKAIAVGEKVGGPLADALLDIAEDAGPLLDAVAGMVQGFADMDEGGQRMVLTFGAMAMGAGPLLTGLGKLVAAIPGITSGLQLLMATGIGPLGVLLGGFPALVIAATAAEQGRYEAMKRGSAADDERRQRMEELADSYRELHDAQVRSLESAASEAAGAEAQLDYCEKRLGRLNELVDAEGRVAEADQDEAESIIGLLNGALGTNMELRDGEVTGIENTADAIRDLIEAKRTEALFNAYQGEYEDAAKNQAQAYDAATEAAKGYSDSLADLNEKKAYEAEMLEAFQRDPETYGKMYRDAQAAAEGASEGFEACNTALRQSAGDMAAAAATTRDYQKAMEEDANGNAQAAQEALNSIQRDADAARANAEANVGALVVAMESMGDASEEAARGTGDSLDDIAVKLASVGVSADELAGMTDQAFASMWASCDGDVSKMKAKLDEWNGKKAEDKAVSVDADGNVVTGEAARKVDELNRKELEDKKAKLTLDTSAAQSALDEWFKYNDNKTISAHLVTSVIGAAQAGASATRSASGGITSGPMSIPRHADGGIAGIATRATLTNYGWVGEDGAEAIVPLTNKRYVRPFALAVAREISSTLKMSDLVANDPAMAAVGSSVSIAPPLGASELKSIAASAAGAAAVAASAGGTTRGGDTYYITLNPEVPIDANALVMEMAEAVRARKSMRGAKTAKFDVRSL